MQQQLEALTIQHLCREGLYGTLSAECNRLRQRRGDDAALLLWRGCALGFQVQPLVTPSVAFGFLEWPKRLLLVRPQSISRRGLSGVRGSIAGNPTARLTATVARVSELQLGTPVCLWLERFRCWVGRLWWGWHSCRTAMGAGSGDGSMNTRVGYSPRANGQICSCFEAASSVPFTFNILFNSLFWPISLPASLHPFIPILFALGQAGRRLGRARAVESEARLHARRHPRPRLLPQARGPA